MSQINIRKFQCDLCRSSVELHDPKAKQPGGWAAIDTGETDPAGHYEHDWKHVCIKCRDKIRTA